MKQDIKPIYESFLETSDFSSEAEMLELAANIATASQLDAAKQNADAQVPAAPTTSTTQASSTPTTHTATHAPATTQTPTAPTTETPATFIKTPFGKISHASGGVAAAPGFRASGVHAGFREDPDRLDFALVLADDVCAAAATFTQNVFCAAPVSVSRAHLNNKQYGSARALIINSGNANAATGDVGLKTAEKSASIAADIIGCNPEDVLVASTGVIGVHLPLEPFSEGVKMALDIASNTEDAALSAARAIMTTDTLPKQAACSFSIDEPEYAGKTFTVGGMAKGSGMIMPNMATMICVITTDAPISDYYLHKALKEAVSESFNKITVDSDTSTNDSCFIFASGTPDVPEFKPACENDSLENNSLDGDVASAQTINILANANSACSAKKTNNAPANAYSQFCIALRAVCDALARQMAADGEGATRLVSVRVFCAANDDDADVVARTIANSPLVKTAIYGHDCNWGRIAAAAGRSGAVFNQSDVDIDIMGIPVCRSGLTVEFSEDEALKRFENKEITIDINLGAGGAHTRIWTCDFTHEYITINGDYRT